MATEGSIASASKRLHLTPQTISGQLSLLEQQLGDALFVRVGRNLELTEAGRMVLTYADEIFSLGNELEDMMKSQPTDRPLVFHVGIADVVPKSIAYRLLAPSLNLEKPVRIICLENTIDFLLAELAVHRIDLVIADGPIPAGMNVRGFSHLLGESGITFFATTRLAKVANKGFPKSLHDMPMLLPGKSTMIYGELSRWFNDLQVNPRIIGEFDDSALMKVFGQAGHGVFMAPTSIAKEVEKQYGVKAIGQTDEVRKQYYAISVERKITHPAVVAITKAARQWLTPGSV